ncbi:Ubiquitin carboxyl-terminal hydrolase MINDY-2 [Rhizoclosmatium hyalinum]|nr:Ubiquitin carboxyl-terminal hydrolase MINDY-2 [Rhizoclosmatium hyalinum]
MSEEGIESSFKIKDIGDGARMLTQQENGPCPLLAIANILLLRGDISIKAEQSIISLESLIGLIGDFLLRRGVELSPSILHLLSVAQFGLDVNVKFDSVRGFEDAAPVHLFSACNIDLVHGWIPDLDSDLVSDLVSVSIPAAGSSGGSAALLDSKDSKDSPQRGIGGFAELVSYNHLMEALVDAEVAAIELSGMKDSAVADMDTSPVAEGKKPVTAESTSELEKHAALEKRMNLGAVAQQFLSSTSTQLTRTGLSQLSSSLQPNSLSVLFRNNHFSTLINHAQLGLFTLVTDEGFLTKKCIWESLSLDGDSMFVDAKFNAYVPTASDEAMETVNIDGVDVAEQERAWKAIVDGDVGGMRTPPAPLHNEDADLALAMQLQDEENQQQAAEQQRRQQQQQQQMQVSQQASPAATTRPSPAAPVKQKKESKEDCLLM